MIKKIYTALIRWVRIKWTELTSFLKSIGSNENVRGFNRSISYLLIFLLAVEFFGIYQNTAIRSSRELSQESPAILAFESGYRVRLSRCFSNYFRGLNEKSDSLEFERLPPISEIIDLCKIPNKIKLKNLGITNTPLFRVDSANYEFILANDRLIGNYYALSDSTEAKLFFKYADILNISPSTNGEFKYVNFWILAISVLVLFGIVNLLKRVHEPVIRKNQIQPPPPSSSGKSGEYDRENYGAIDYQAIDKLEEKVNIDNQASLLLFLEIKKYDLLLKNLLVRANGMLILSLLIALIGVIGFVSIIPSYDFRNGPFSDYLVASIKPVLILVFVQGITWFFLRQYRMSMEDYKSYLDRRERKVNQFVSNVILSSEPSKDGNGRGVSALLPITLLANDLSGKLAPGESTEKIESLKLLEKNPMVQLIKEFLGYATKE